MQTLAIIPARGGSKAVPRKNVMPLCGKPLIAWTIEAALNARTLDRVVVSTEDPEIARTAERYGAEVVWRPLEIAGDSASSELALLHAVDFLREKENYRPDRLAFLQCTSPLTLPEDIDGTVNALEERHADTALAVAEFHYFLWKRQADDSCVGINHDKSIRQLRQQKQPQYLETGAVYAMRTEGFLKAKHRFFGETAIYVMPVERTLEIDEPIHFRIAEMVLRERQSSARLTSIPQEPGALILDFDGVFTDNRVMVFDDGREAVFCSRSDGMGLEWLRSLDLPVMVLSKETNPVVAARCAKLRIECHQGIQDKRTLLEEWLVKRGIDPSRTLYVGNDVNDLECMRLVGCPVTVADAYPSVKAASRIVLENRGGHGAIRELAELILQRCGRTWP